MDISDFYINMCEEAREIQLAHLFYEAGDFYFGGRDTATGRPKFSITSEIFAGKKRAIGNIKTWLPRQDQLQKIVGNYNEQCRVMHEYLTVELLVEDHELDSMEKLWLKILMKEKYHKVWNAGEWVRQT